MGGGVSVGDRVVSALFTTQRGLPPPFPHIIPTPRTNDAASTSFVKRPVIVSATRSAPGPDNLPLQGIHRVSCAATQGGRGSASQSAGRHLLALTSQKNFLSSPPSTPGSTPSVEPRLESRERSNGRCRRAAVALCFALSLNKRRHQRRPATSPETLVPSRGQAGLPAELRCRRVSRLSHDAILQGSEGPFAL